MWGDNLNIIQKAWGWIKNLFSRTEIEKMFDTKIISTTMDEYVKLWDSMFRNAPPWLIDNEVEKIVSLGLPPLIAKGLATQVTLELKSTIGNDELLNVDYQNVVKRSAQIMEFVIAKGGVMLKPFKIGVDVFVAIYQPEKFKVTKINALNQITGVIFEDTFHDGDYVYTKFEYRNFDEKLNQETIRHVVYRAKKGSTPQRIDLTISPIWAELLPEIIAYGTSNPLFVYISTPLVQSIDYDSPLGISSYHVAKDLIKSADELYSSMLWEFKGSELKVFADETLFVDGTDKKLKRLFYKLNPTGGADGGTLPIDIFSPPIRYDAYIRGLDTVLKQIEDLIGLSRGTMSSEISQARTATEIKVLKQRTYATIKSNQKQLQDGLTALVKAMYFFKHERESVELEVTFDFDDSIINDKDKDRETAMLEVSSGLMSKRWYMLNVRNLSEEQADEELNSMTQQEFSMIESQNIDLTLE